MTFALLALALVTAVPVAQRDAPPAPSPAPTAAPSPTPSPAPRPALIATFPPSATATATPIYNFIYRATPAPGSTPFPQLGAPEILEIDVTDQTIAVPGPLHVRILTSDSVVSVVAESYGYEVEIPKTGRGVFAFDGILPVLPDVVKGKSFDVDVVATSKDGRTVTLTLPFMLK
jgi:hypothetical protein